MNIIERGPDFIIAKFPLKKGMNNLKGMNKTKLKKKEIEELMEGLGFHYIPSKHRWKMKKVNIMTVTDYDLDMNNEDNNLLKFLEQEFEEQLDTLKQYERKQKMIRIFFQ